jgi:hypothetical protein
MVTTLPPFSIFVKNSDGKKILLENISGDDSIHAVKQKLEGKEGFFFFGFLFYSQFV